MIDFSEDQFRDLCRDGSIQIEIASVEEKRKAAARLFWLALVVSVMLGVAIAWALIAYDWLELGLTLGMVVIVGGIFQGMRPLNKVGSDLKMPLLEGLARIGGIDYRPDGFDPPVYDEARNLLFGELLSSQEFSDLFQGADGEGRRYAIYEATLKLSSGKSTTTIFSGQIYAFQRRARSGGQIAIVPDRGFLNVFGQRRGLERVKFDSDPAFESKFEVHAAQPHEALMLVGTDLRRKLLDWRSGGRVFAYVGPEDVLVAITGKNRFEPGSLFRSHPGEKRARLIFDDVRGSLATLRSLKASLE